jgi:hypothetical protein
MIYFAIFFSLIIMYKIIRYLINRSIIKKIERFKTESKDFHYGVLMSKDGRFYLYGSEINKETMFILLDELISFYKKRGFKWI